MKRAVLVLVVAFFNVTVFAAGDQHGDDRPNILLLMAEDMSSRVNAFGDAVALTPNLDRLAENGVRYSNVYTTSGVCAPSRAAHITGVHQIAIGAQHMRSGRLKSQPYRAVPAPEIKAYPELLRHAGYYTFTNQKLDYQFSGIFAGSGPFTIWDYEGSKPDWNRREDGQPFYGLINLLVTHESQLFEKSVERNRIGGLQQVTDAGQVSVPPYYPDTAVVRAAIAQQYDNIHAMDKQVGDLLAKLSADGLADNTIVIWTTDHGDGLPRAKREIYDSGIKVPAIVYWPERLRPLSLPKGSVDQRLISFVDFAPSILKLLGIAVPDYIQGVPSLFDQTVTRDYVYASKDRMDEFPFRERAIRGPRYKYIDNYREGVAGARHLAYRDQLAIMQELWSFFESGKLNEQQAYWFKPRPRLEFYDLATDPHEIHNLADDPEFAVKMNRFREVLNDRLALIGDLSEMAESEMAEQFWPEGKQPKTAVPVIHSAGEHAVKLVPSEPHTSIGYRINDGDWKAYLPNSRLEVPQSSLLSVKAVRYGWLESELTRQQF
ncbi:MAG: sulfatase [Oceanicoccus sp.]